MERNKTLMNGFTLTEILVVLFIISLLSGLAFANFRQGGKQMALQRSAYKLAQDIRRVQEMAIAAKEYSGQIPPGYGIYIPKNVNYYILYADTNPPGGNQRYDSGDEMETSTLESGIQITSNLPSTSWVSINFQPPDPKITITIVSGGITTTTVATTTLSLISDPAIQKKVIINTVGLVEVK